MGRYGMAIALCVHRKIKENPRRAKVRGLKPTRTMNAQYGYCRLDWLASAQARYGAPISETNRPIGI
jgi:hypothetical protein